MFEAFTKKLKYFTPVLFVLWSCGHGTEQEAGSTLKTDTALDTSMKALQKAGRGYTDIEKAFINRIVADGMTVTAAGKFVLPRTKDKSIRKFAEMTVGGQQKINTDLQQVIKTAGMELPSQLPDTKSKGLEKIKESAGVELNKNYIIMMINEHKDIIDQFDRATTFKNNAIRQFALRNLPALKQQGKLADTLGKQLNMTNAGNGDNLSNVEADTTR